MTVQIEASFQDYGFWVSYDFKLNFLCKILYNSGLKSVYA